MLSASKLAAACGAQVAGSADRMIAAVAPLEIARACDLAWVGDVSGLAEAAASTNAGVLLIPRTDALPVCNITFLLCSDPVAARSLALEALDRHAGQAPADSAACLGSDVVVSPHAVLGAAVVIGAGSSIGPNCVIEDGVELGARCQVGAGCIVGRGSRIGAECCLGPGSIVGAPPDAYECRDGAMRPVPACGVVVLGDQVLVGAGTVIQRGVERATLVGVSTAIGSQCVIGHDSRVGSHCMIGAQSGVAASCDVGDHVLISVQVGLNVGVRVGDRARIGAKSGVMKNVPEGETWQGSPAEPKMTFWRRQVASGRLARHRAAVSQTQLEP